MNLCTPIHQDDLKRAAALAAVAQVDDGMLVGLGTGTTAPFAIEALGKRAAEGLRITTVASAAASAMAATAAGLKGVEFDGLASVDVCIDGADEINPYILAIKGAGGVLLREKVTAAAARMPVIVDESKQVAQLGAHRLPIRFDSGPDCFGSASVGNPGSLGPRLVSDRNRRRLCRNRQRGPLCGTETLGAQP